MISQGEGCREDVGRGRWQHTRQTFEKSPTSKLSTTWAHILSDRNVFAPQGGGGTAESNAPGPFYPAVRTGSSNTRFFTPPSGRGLVIPVFFFFYSAVRTGSSFFFLSWSVAPDLRSVKTILAGKLCSFSVYSPEFS